MSGSADEESVERRSDADEAADSDLDISPRATTPIAPFGDAKPWAGSVLGDEVADPDDRADEN
ncbi:MAG TPA: hypothetical protein VM305_01655 [Candidatus Limnocylindrales bacterium]|nr:hypothetical protein [Candidatus Limnocylindrales bacterium]